MRRVDRFRLRGPLLGLLLAALPCARAQAQQPADKAAADALFDEGKRLMKEGKLAEACPKFEESQKLDPGVGTLLYLAECHERAGKTASAWSTYRQAAAAAAAAGQGARATAARERVAALEPRLSRLVVQVSDTPGLAVTRNGAALARAMWGTSLPVDPGSYTLEATAPGRRPWSTTVTLDAPGTRTVQVPPLDPAPAPAASASSAAAPAASSAPPAASSAPPAAAPATSAGSLPGPSLRRPLALGAGALSLGALAAASYFALEARSTYGRSRPFCRADNHCTQPGHDLVQEARRDGTTASVLVALGAAAAGAAAALWFTAPGPAGARLGLGPAGLRVEGAW